MVQQAAKEGEPNPPGRRRRWRRNVLRIFVVMLVLAVLAAWLQRKEIADTFIADTFAQNDIRATYDVETISPRLQVLTDLVIGDPERPDLTIERLELGITPRFGLPDLTSITLVRPRIYGSYRAGELSFGDLDPLLFGEDTEEPFAFPNAQLTIEDGRGLLETDYGRVGLKLAGGGHLRGGFRAELAAVSEELSLPGCTLQSPTIYGEVSIDAERPGFAGPMRFASLECSEQGLVLNDGVVQVAGQAERNLTDFDGTYSAAIGEGAFADARTDQLTGEGRFAWRDGNLTALYDVTAKRLETAAASAAELTAEGRIRTLEDFARVEVNGDVAGTGIALGAGFDAQLASAAAASEGTLAAPLITKVRTNLPRAMRGATLSATFDARVIGNLTNVVLPDARLRGGNGATLLSLSRAQVALGGQGLPRFSGNLAAGGEGLPQISGRMERGGNGALELRLAMREYSAGDARLAIPQLSVMQGRDGRIALQGRALASGPLARRVCAGAGAAD